MSIIPVFAEIFELVLSNPLLAYLTLITAFSVDTYISTFVKFQGVAGWIATQAIQFILNNKSIEITSFQILILVVIFPLIVYAVSHSRQNVSRA